jgi:hypothetical protein
MPWAATESLHETCMFDPNRCVPFVSDDDGRYDEVFRGRGRKSSVASLIDVDTVEHDALK